MSVLQDVLSWSEDPKRPLWQRVGLRLLLVRSSLTDEDMEELAQVALAEQGYHKLEAAPQALSLEDLPDPDQVTSPTSLIKLYGTSRVNALAENQEIDFEKSGVTVIYGDNGAGKSGYARILRRACRARARGESILPNVFDANAVSGAEAHIDYEVGDTPGTVHWRDEEAVGPQLSAVSFFDSDCASIHVGEANDLAYTPFGLDLLPKLVDVSKSLRERLERLLEDHNRSKPVSLLDLSPIDGTAAHGRLLDLSADSVVDDFRKLGTLSAKEVDRLDEITKLLADDPLLEATELETKLGRIRQLLRTVETTEAALSLGSIGAVREALSESTAAREASRIASEEAFSSQPLPHVGSETWGRLWESARRFSEEAYGGADFPHVAEGSRCLLCQQPLTDEAADRLRGFEQFIQRDTQKTAREASRKLDACWDEVMKGDFRTTNYRDGLSDLKLLDPSLCQTVRVHLSKRLRQLRTLYRAKSRDHWTHLGTVNAAPLDNLKLVIETTSSKAQALRAASKDDERGALKSEYAELHARKWLGGILDDVEVEIARLGKAEQIKKAIVTTHTNSITLLSTKLTNEYITDILHDRFEKEASDLGAAYLRVGLEPVGGKYGQLRLRITLDGALPEADVPSVLSEGEHRCIALAGFLAELATEATGSAIVFDDPVCSLDHSWRRRVALKLVSVARARQVVVFTHDIVFLLDLQEFAEASGIPLSLSHLRRSSEGAGVRTKGLPWGALRTKARIGVMRSEYQQAEAVYRKQRPTEYEPLAAKIYQHLRQTWERAVEEVLLNGVVTRFERGIHTQQLKKLHDITEADLDAVDKGMTKSSRFIQAHDQASAVNEPIPVPDELKADIDALDDWVKAIRNRR
jgi:energy-coupling factor transporter ATP-binding protein EcfA2